MTKKEEILLSISLLVSGRKETRKCLDSLKPFMEQLPCELILVDTGCDEETRAIIEEYTDNIVNFTWCADFSKARNAGLKKAKGKWFLYLDDDEWFEDPSEIIEFFNSGEYKHYHSACYQQRNYSDYQESNYKDANVSRMIEMEKHTEFQSSIHEYLYPLKGPVKLFDCYVKHFGYIFDTPKKKYDHSKRNVDLLLDMMKKEPMNFRWDTQILQEYMGIGEYEKIIETAIKAIGKYEKMKQKGFRNERELGTFYGYLVEAYDRKYDYEREAESLKEAFRRQELTKMAQAFLHRCAVKMHYKQENYKKCVAAFEEYMKIYQKIGQDKEELYRQGGMLIGDTFQKVEYEDMILLGIMAALKIEREDILEKYFYQLGWKDTRMLLHPDFMGIVINYMAEQEFKESYVGMAKTVAERANNIDSVVKILQKIEEEYHSFDKSEKREDGQLEFGMIDDEETKEQQKLLEHKFYSVVFLFSHVESEHWYITYLKLLSAKENGKIQEIHPLFDNLFSHIFDIFNLDTIIWEIAEEYQIDMEPFFLRIDFDTWRNGICQWIEYSNWNDIAYKEKLIKKWKKTENIRYDFLFMKMKEGYLLHTNEELVTFDVLEQELFEFAEAEREFYGTVYKENVFEDNLEMLPQECRIAVWILKVKEKREEKDDAQTVAVMKKLVNVYPPLNKIVRLYAEKFGEAVKERDEKADEAKRELLELAEVLKKQVKVYLEQGKEEEAMALLLQIRQYVPEDEEIVMQLNLLQCR